MEYCPGNNHSPGQQSLGRPDGEGKGTWDHHEEHGTGITRICGQFGRSQGGFGEAEGTVWHTQRWNTLKSFLWITQRPDEHILAVITRIREAQRLFVNSRPQDYSVEMFDSELLTSVLISGTPAYSTLTESLLTMPDLTSMKVESALVTAMAPKC